MNSERQVKRKLGHVIQIRVCPAFDINVMPGLQRLLTFCPKCDEYSSKYVSRRPFLQTSSTGYKKWQRCIKTGNTPFQEYSPNHFISQTTEICGLSVSGRSFAWSVNWPVNRAWIGETHEIQSWFVNYRDLMKLQRQRKPQKSNKFNEQNKNSACASRFFVHFLAVLRNYNVTWPLFWDDLRTGTARR